MAGAGGGFTKIVVVTLVARPRADGPFVGAAEPRLEESAFSGR